MATATYHSYSPAQAERQSGSQNGLSTRSGLVHLGSHIARACADFLSAVELSRALETASPQEQRDLALTWLGGEDDR